MVKLHRKGQEIMEMPASVTKGHWVTRYARGITVLGVLMILGGAARWGAVIHQLFDHRIVDATFWMIFWFNSFDSAKWCVIGFLTMALSQLLVYVMGSGSKPGWILRKANGGLFIAASLSIGTAAVHFVSLHMSMSHNVSYFAGDWLVAMATNGAAPLLSGLSEALLYVTLGFTLRRVLPVIEESKGVV